MGWAGRMAFGSVPKPFTVLITPVTQVISEEPTRRSAIRVSLTKQPSFIAC